MPDSPTTWMPRERWDALVRGDGCPLCRAVATDVLSGAYGHTVADLELGRLRLSRNQYVTGYAVLICKQHVREPYELTRDERARFFEDMVRSAQALERVFKPDKMNFEMLGNAIPHLHCHLLPRYYGDPAPSKPINPDAEERHLPAEEYERLVRAIRAEL